MSRISKNKAVSEYIALFEYDVEAGGIGVVFPDLEGCFSAGYDFSDAFKMAHEALSFYAEDNPSMPCPRTLEQIKTEWESWKEWESNYNFYITKIALFPIKPKTKKFNISLDERLVRRIDRVTDNRSAFIADAVENMLNSSTV